MQIVDANIILRYILDDNAELSPIAKDIIDNNSFEVPIEVLCEVIYVLQGVYSTPRDKIREAISEFFSQTDSYIPHADAINKALEYYVSKNLDFVDCILAGYAETEDAQVHTFDKKLNKLIEAVSSK
jgi:predicted nucleic-acid-binding protein